MPEANGHRGLLFHDDGTPFATGHTQYYIGESQSEAAGRLVIELAIEGQRTTAALDTGGHYLVCNPDFLTQLANRLTEDLGQARLNIRGEVYSGSLHRLAVEIPAGTGESCRLEATVFVPVLTPGQIWRLPNIIGWTGMLERIRFAVDPDSDLFYFDTLA